MAISSAKARLVELGRDFWRSRRRRVDSHDKDGAGERTSLYYSRHDLVQSLRGVVTSAKTLIVFVKGLNVDEEAFGEAGSFADETNELVGDAWKGSAETKQYDSW